MRCLGVLLFVASTADGQKVSVQSSCTGSNAPAAQSEYEGKVSVLGVGETLNVKILDIDASGTSGHADIKGSGVSTVDCESRPVTKKAGSQDITVDFGSCLPSGIEIETMQVCSDQDTIHVCVKDDNVGGIKICGDLKKKAVDFVAVNVQSTCTGGDAPPAQSEYEGSVSVLGHGETLNVKILDIDTSGTSGHADIKGSGISTVDCEDKPVTKASGSQDLTVDFGSCLPSGIEITTLKMCSDQSMIHACVKDHNIGGIQICMDLKKKGMIVV